MTPDLLLEIATLTAESEGWRLQGNVSFVREVGASLTSDAIVRIEALDRAAARMRFVRLDAETGDVVSTGYRAKTDSELEALFRTPLFRAA
ncbi:MAG: hypothetical protein HY903_01630 [Deltaproteobacteria bacterium]|nr:hypothetical protein [Deltaproteobacteria bacterium]